MEYQFYPTREDMFYPVGHNLVKNLPAIKQMGDEIGARYHDNKIHLFCQGSSGAIIAGIVVANLTTIGIEAEVNHVKKEGEWSHHSGAARIGSFDDNSVCIIIDDFISSGETVNRIYAEYENCMKMSGRPVKLDALVVRGNVHIGGLQFDAKLLLADNVC